MTELARHIGPDTDVPAGDIGVGAREIGYLFGQYKRLTSSFHGVLTGKGISYGGSLIRPEATGYGLVYFLDAFHHATRGEPLTGKRVAVSGSGNVAQYGSSGAGIEWYGICRYCVAKLLHLGAIPVTMSDSSGYIYDPDGFDEDKLMLMMDLKNNRRGRVSELCQHPSCSNVVYVAGKSPWQEVKCDIALPCATQNELNQDDATALVANGCYCVCEGANMPSTPGAIRVLRENSVMFGPAKAANAGGVAVSGLEMCQNSGRISWTRDVVDQKLKEIMVEIHQNCVSAASDLGHPDDLQMGANVAGFLKVADAMISQGCV
jgi:glutamate dehydrogenase (NADP+)